MNEEQFDNEFDALFKEQAPAPDQNRKSAVIEQSKAEFFQAFAKANRLNKEGARHEDSSIFKSLWRFLMSPIQNPTSYKAIATGAVAFFALSLIVYLPRPGEQQLIVYSPESAQQSPNTSSPDSAGGSENDSGIKRALETATYSQHSEEQDNEVVSSEPSIEFIETADDVDLTVPGKAARTPKALSKDDTAQARSSSTLESQMADNSPTPIIKAEVGLKSQAKEKKSIAQTGSIPEANNSMPFEGSTLVEAQTSASPVVAQQVERTAKTRILERREQSQSLEEVIVTGSKVSASELQSLAYRTPMVSDSGHSRPAVRPDSGEEYAEYKANPIIQVSEQPVSTFSVDVDTAAYSLVRNQLNRGYLPKPQAVRAEELVNYFDYDYKLPSNKKEPFKPSISVLDSPWNEGRKLVHIGIKGYDIASAEQPDTNLVFLLDVSGSMNQANKLPLVKQSLGLLLDSMKPSDAISIAVYAGAAGVVLEPTPAREKAKILQSLNNLSAGGSTAGGQGIRLAYQLAEQNFDKKAVNRIILATDGDFNVGQSSNEDLKTLVERKRDQGIYLSVLGFGRNNYQDDMMQTLAQNGNGVAAYIDTLSEAKKVLVDEASSTLFPIAKDVKIQVEFNPVHVSDYRLVGYETRALNREDFNNDKVDAGDIGAGHTVTAIYEITPTGNKDKSVDPLRYAEQAKVVKQSNNAELGFLKIRYKLPSETKSRLIETPISTSLNQASEEARFSVAVAGFAQLLANSKHTGKLDFDAIIKQANASKGRDEFGYRTEFIQLVRMAKIAQP